jgi:transcriptional regulator with XRE-family HTH domain
MEKATDFGKLLRIIKDNNNLSQEQMAKELDVSPSALSNYIIGKNVPEIDFLAKCIDKFNLLSSDIDLSDFLLKAFLSSARNNHKVIINTQFIDDRRIDILAKILTVLILYPIGDITQEAGSINDLRLNISQYYSALKKERDFRQHSK